MYIHDIEMSEINICRSLNVEKRFLLAIDGQDNRKAAKANRLGTGFYKLGISGKKGCIFIMNFNGRKRKYYQESGLEIKI